MEALSHELLNLFVEMEDLAGQEEDLVQEGVLMQVTSISRGAFLTIFNVLYSSSRDSFHNWSPCLMARHSA